MAKAKTSGVLTSRCTDLLMRRCCNNANKRPQKCKLSKCRFRVIELMNASVVDIYTRMHKAEEYMSDVLVANHTESLCR